MADQTREELAREVVMLRARLVESERQRASSAGAEGSPESHPTITSLGPDEIAFPYQALDAQGRLLDVNAAWQTLLGYRKEDAIGKYFGDLLVPTSAEAFRGCFADVTAEDAERREEFEVLRKDGTPMWVAVAGRIVWHGPGGIQRVHCVLHDITRRKVTEASLATRNRQLEAVRAVSEEITRESELQTLLGLITRRAVELVDAESGAVHLWDEAGQVVVPQAWHGKLLEWQADIRYHPGEGVVGTVALRREGLIVNDYRRSAHAHPVFVARTDIGAVLAEPLS
ncbi:MAG TPA: PAS domain S-box protein, partial [Candidatus Methylomirabilis sp.]|nr:PAS domain S-box protein [Candidatus Methylomirabilis sp.]